jgi:hypothetical protein
MRSPLARHAPGKFNIYINSALGEDAPRERHHLGRHALAFKILKPAHRRSFRDTQYPAGRLERRLRIDETFNFNQIDSVLNNPVAAGNSRIQRSVGDVTRHLLRPQEPATQRAIIHPWNIGTLTNRDSPPRLAH